MSRYPKRPREHVVEDEAIDFIKNILPKEWIIEITKKDYGIDLNVEIVIDSNVTGAHFIIQSKGTDKPKFLKRDASFAQTFKTSTLQYYLERQELVVMVVFDSTTQTGYWIWIQDFIQSNLLNILDKQENAIIHIPKENRFDKEAIKLIEQRVFKAHDQSVLVTAMQTSKNPFIGYNIFLNERETRFDIYEKFPGALEQNPIEIEGVFKFDQSNEAQEVYAAFLDSIKKGESVTISSRYIDKFDFSKLAPEIFTHFGEIKPIEIQMGSATNDDGIIVRFEILDENKNSIAEIPYVELRVEKRGTEEITLSNRQQKIPLKVIYIIYIPSQKSKISFNYKFAGCHIEEIQKTLLFFKACQQRRTLQIKDITDGSVLEKISSFIIDSKIEDGFFTFIDDIADIQKRTDSIIIYPERITDKDILIIKSLSNILATGKISITNPTYPFSCKKEFANSLLIAFEEKGLLSLKFTVAESCLNLFGVQIDLGERIDVIPKAKLNESTLDSLKTDIQDLEKTNFNIVLDLCDQNSFMLFPKWLPKQTY